MSMISITHSYPNFITDLSIRRLSQNNQKVSFLADGICWRSDLEVNFHPANKRDQTLYISIIGRGWYKGGLKINFFMNSSLLPSFEPSSGGSLRTCRLTQCGCKGGRFGLGSLATSPPHVLSQPYTIGSTQVHQHSLVSEACSYRVAGTALNHQSERSPARCTFVGR